MNMYTIEDFVRDQIRSAKAELKQFEPENFHRLSDSVIRENLRVSNLAMLESSSTEDRVIASHQPYQFIRSFHASPMIEALENSKKPIAPVPFGISFDYGRVKWSSSRNLAVIDLPSVEESTIEWAKSGLSHYVSALNNCVNEYAMKLQAGINSAIAEARANASQQIENKKGIESRQGVKFE